MFGFVLGTFGPNPLTFFLICMLNNVVRVSDGVTLCIICKGGGTIEPRIVIKLLCNYKRSFPKMTHLFIIIHLFIYFLSIRG